jgi:hypothetical protein
MSQDLFTDAINHVTAIDCRLERESIHVGAIYIESDTPCEKIRISNGEKAVYIHIPPDLLHKPDPYIGWNLRFDITPEDEGLVAQPLPAEPPAEPSDPAPSYPLSE